MQANTKKIKIVAISDTHDKHKYLKAQNLPPADIFIHAGDFTTKSKAKQFNNFRTFLQSLPYKHKIVIPGNHDFALQCNQDRYKHICEIFNVKEKDLVDPEVELKKLKEVCTFLHHQAIQIEGITIFGSPYVISNQIMGFSYYPQDGAKMWENIPKNIDVLVTHGPPEGILDINIRSGQKCGCKHLREKVEQIKPKYHIFGHIHEGNGKIKLGETEFHNVAFINEKCKPINEPRVIEIQIPIKNE